MALTYKQNQRRRAVWLAFVIAAIVFIFLAYLHNSWVESSAGPQSVGIVKQCDGSCKTISLSEMAHPAWQAVAVMVGCCLGLLILEAIAIALSFRYHMNNKRFILNIKRTGTAANIILFAAMLIWPIGLDNTTATPCNGIDPSMYFMCDPWDIGFGVYLMIIGMVLLSFSVCFSMLISSKPLRPSPNDKKEKDQKDQKDQDVEMTNSQNPRKASRRKSAKRTHPLPPGVDYIPPEDSNSSPDTSSNGTTSPNSSFGRAVNSAVVANLMADHGARNKHQQQQQQQQKHNPYDQPVVPYMDILTQGPMEFDARAFGGQSGPYSTPYAGPSGFSFDERGNPLMHNPLFEGSASAGSTRPVSVSTTSFGAGAGGAGGAGVGANELSYFDPSGGAGAGVGARGAGAGVGANELSYFDPSGGAGAGAGVATGAGAGVGARGYSVPNPGAFTNARTGAGGAGAGANELSYFDPSGGIQMDTFANSAALPGTANMFDSYLQTDGLGGGGGAGGAGGFDNFGGFGDSTFSTADLAAMGFDTSMFTNP